MPNKKQGAAILQNIYIFRGASTVPVFIMNVLKINLLRIVRQKAAERAAALSREYINAKPWEKEAIVAGINFEKWLSQACDMCLN